MVRKGVVLLLLATPALADPLDELRAVQAQFAGLESVRLSARAVITKSEGNKDVQGVATYRFWASGDRYKVEYTVNDASLGLAPSYTYAYNGSTYQFYAPNLDTLSLKVGEQAADHAGLPNPLFVLADYLTVSDQVGLRLRHVTNPEHWRARLALAKPITDEQARAGVEIGSYRVWPRAERLWLIARVDPASTASVEFRMPQDFSELENALLRMRRHDADGHVVVDYVIRSIDVNVPIEASEFTLSHEIAGNVWDSDTDSFLKKAKKPTKP